MKSIIIALVLISAILSLNLKNQDDDKKIVKAVNYNDVKSPGEFSNIAPEATKIITPKYSSKN